MHAARNAILQIGCNLSAAVAVAPAIEQQQHRTLNQIKQWN